MLVRVFGAIIYSVTFFQICVVNNHKLASDLAFASAVRLRVVTTDGDDVKPDGSLSGGTCTFSIFEPKNKFKPKTSRKTS